MNQTRPGAAGQPTLPSRDRHHKGMADTGAAHDMPASTLILLDEDRRSGRVSIGDLAAFLWVGAGNGAMNGYAAMLL